MFDASSLVGAAIKQDSVPERTLLKALAEDVIALSPEVEAELADVLCRPKFAGTMTVPRRDRVLALVRDAAVWFDPVVVECRDQKDNKYLELALAARADIIVSSDGDLLVMHPWRTVRILNPATYLQAR